MNWFYSVIFIWVHLFSPGVVLLSEACWGTTAPNYGDTSRDYDLLVGSEVNINCTLKSENLPGISEKVDSSNLVFTKDNQDLSNYSHIIDSTTAQLIIPNAQISHSGIYHCGLSLPDKTSKPHVCSTQVSVGYAPKNVTNFKCLSRNFDNLTCTWEIEPNKVKTNYSLQKNLFFMGAIQNCPMFNNTFCQWRDDTDPPYQTSIKNLVFTVLGNNSLGTSENEFTLDHFEIVIPNSPENLSSIDIGQHHLKLQWLPPTMNNIVDKPPLFYQLWLEELGPDPLERMVIDVGVDSLSYTLNGLTPFYLYNISLRCRSQFALKEEMWSPITSLTRKTLADIPTVLPDVNPLAFELYNFGEYRNVTLYWKPIKKRDFNGKDFHYYITYNPVATNDNVSYENSISPVLTIGHLNNDSAYVFKIYSANKEGISKKFKEIYIAERNKIASSPYDIRAISNELGYYNLTWATPEKMSDYTFTVFWCSNAKPSNSRCDGPIQWSNDGLKENSFILNVTDIHINFQFAVVAAVGNKSSGMEWASCIVPQKAPLGKIPIRHIEQRDSSSLKIIWNLDCEAQKSVIDRYEITYCRLERNSGCKVAKANPNEESYVLKNLHPFSNYSIKLRAFNKENIPSVDMKESFQSTLAGAPSDPPHGIQIVPKGTSIHVEWLPPLEPNGIITKYFINYNGARQKVVPDSFSDLSFDIEDLSYYTKYNISIEACVEEHCSPKSHSLTVLTDVGEPGVMNPPLPEIINSTNLKISWKVPMTPNGPIDYYRVKWLLKDGNKTNYKESQSLSTIVEVDCSSVGEGGLNYLFYVQAVNKKNDTILQGPFSDSFQATACIMSQGQTVIIGLAIGGTLALAIFMLVFFRLVKWMHDKIHQMKNIAVKLPKELEGPELNPLSNYENFKQGLVQKSQNYKCDRLSYIFEENENKNRHGSGSSQFSNSSADELVFKNGKCAKFGRKPSGDSSGCSSMSSNTTTRIQLSSDSGAESDIPVSASPDSALMEHSILNIQKPPLPILMEQEALDLTSELLTKSNRCNFIQFKGEHPYSKFGISGVSSMAPWNDNSLAFYSCNLANSEPSVFDSQKFYCRPSEMTPYSKVGLAKSSSDILSIVSSNKGYSKFGLVNAKNYTVNKTSNINPTIRVAGSKQNSKTVHLMQNGSNCKLAEELACYGDYIFESKGKSNKYKLEKDYLTRTQEQSVPKNLSSGYVPFGDVMCKKDGSSAIKGSISHEMDDFEDLSLLEIPPESVDANLLRIMKDIFKEDKYIAKTLVTSDQHLIDLNNSSSSVNSFEMPQIVSDFSVTKGDSVHQYTKNIPSLNFKGIHPNDDVLLEVKQQTNEKLLSHSSDAKLTNTSNEILLTPVVSKNGYVPFPNFSSSDQIVQCVPNNVETNVPLSIFPSDICSDSDQNYITPSNKGDLKLLQKNLVSKKRAIPKVIPIKSRDTSESGSVYTLNGNNISKISKPLKHLLKPRVESEICEV